MSFRVNVLDHDQGPNGGGNGGGDRLGGVTGVFLVSEMLNR